jgi:hypothetical protein
MVRFLGESEECTGRSVVFGRESSEFFPAPFVGKAKQRKESPVQRLHLLELSNAKVNVIERVHG